MQRISIGLLSGILILTACAQREVITPVGVPQTVTGTPSPVPTNTNTSIPTETQTASITPLPTIPTFTPTFDASTIRTVTPAPKAECPPSIPYPEKNLNLFYFKESGNYKSTQEAVLWFLNKYGPEVVVNYEKKYKTSEEMAFWDLTNDEGPELALRLTIGLTTFDIFGCRDGEYQVLLSIPSNGLGYAPIIFSREDNNKNGIPELTILEGYLSQGGHSFAVYEWDGEKFAAILSPFVQNNPDSRFLWVETTGEIYYEDIDHDFINELILDSGVPVWETYWSGLPWRNKRTYYKWNGQVYSQHKFEFAPPDYRFQSVQDADLATSQQDYDKALGLYQNVVFSEKLKDFSPEIRDNLRAIWDSQYGDARTPTPYSSALDEYPKLAAYAYYRILLIHLVQGQDSEAAATYTILGQTFGDDPYARPYVEMATAFWEAYQSPRRMYNGCAAAIQYAAEHPEILIPLGSDYHGWQSHTYVPADVCPFR